MDLMDLMGQMNPKRRDGRSGPARRAGLRRLLAGVVIALLTLALLYGAGVIYRQASQANETPPGTLLPGEAMWGSWPSYLFGVNDGVNWDPQRNMDIPPVGPNIQARLKAAHVPIARVWFFQRSLVDQRPLSDAEQLQKLQAVQNAGMRCFANLPTENSIAYDLHLVTLLRGKCAFYEVMNEPDIEGVSSTAYLAFWNSFVPQARALDPGARFGGPADYSNQGAECSYYANGTSACFLQKVLAGMAKSGVPPDFVTYHWYPCWQDTASECLAKADGFSAAAQQVLTWTKQAFPGKSIPVGLSEWNAHPGSPSYMNDGSWMAQFVTHALLSMRASGLAFAMEFDVAGYGNYGADDMFDIFHDGAPKAQFTAFARLIASARSHTAPPSPTPSPALQPSPS
ncbi:MAG TPA: hypothetical protein VFQ25_11560 [Ktedonobacterales bacterium]|nr:hypothetical protein [Ktedonobacterales bacterium]